MREDIDQMVINEANYILTTKQTVRECARFFSVSKSTVHKDIMERLPKLNRPLFEQVRHVMDQNKAERHIRGGAATKEKYCKTKDYEQEI